MNLTKKLWIKVKDSQTQQLIISSLLTDYLEKDLIESFGIYEKDINQELTFLDNNSFYLTFDDNFDYFAFCKLISKEFKTRMLCWISGNFFYFDDNGFFSNSKNPFENDQNSFSNQEDISNLFVNSDSEKEFKESEEKDKNDDVLDTILESSENFYVELEKKLTENEEKIEDEILNSLSSESFIDELNMWNDFKENVLSGTAFADDSENSKENECCKDDCCEEVCAEDACCSSCSDEFDLCLSGCCNWNECCSNDGCKDECCNQDTEEVEEQVILSEFDDFGLLDSNDELFVFSNNDSESEENCCSTDGSCACSEVENDDSCCGDSCCSEEENSNEFEEEYKSYLDLLDANDDEESCENCNCSSSSDELNLEFLDFSSSEDKKEDSSCCDEDMCSTCDGCSWDFDSDFDHNEILKTQINNSNQEDFGYVEYVEEDNKTDDNDLSHHFECVCEDKVMEETQNISTINKEVDFTDNEEIKETESISTLFDEVNEMKANEEIFNKDDEKNELNFDDNSNSSVVEEEEYDQLFSNLESLDGSDSIENIEEEVNLDFFNTPSIEDIKNKDLITAEELELLLESNESSSEPLTEQKINQELDLDNLSEDKKSLDFESFFTEITSDDLAEEPNFNDFANQEDAQSVEEEPIDFESFFTEITNETSENNDVNVENLGPFFTEISNEDLIEKASFSDLVPEDHSSFDEPESVDYSAFLPEIGNENEVKSEVKLDLDSLSDEKFVDTEFNVEELYSFQTSDDDSKPTVESPSSLEEEVKEFFSDLSAELSNIPDVVENKKENNDDIVIEDISINSDLDSLDLSSSQLFETEFLPNELKLDEEMNNQFSTLVSPSTESSKEADVYEPNISADKIVSDKQITSDLQKFLEDLKVEKEKLRMRRVNLEKKTAKIKNMFNDLNSSSDFNN
ncbi:hypothetical protein D8X55_01465 [Malacoplasma penetrans]|uniref:hypothetical protein n=1 Tax=Malacoplasma penetrans TaxID=28227 RepID=UPI00101329D5|nr:hypothetical protein [Malacoplasma penetrans]RXY97125.1 hypothetical protein D8X55_01465 [Malacoplasma penetrans]